VSTNKGSVQEFRNNWDKRPESVRYHFKRGQPDNQIQFAFQNHWRVFRNIIGSRKSGRALEVGCGRGSMGAFFADNGFEVHLLDTSTTALKNALSCFNNDGLNAHSICGDALALPYRDAEFDVIVSIGLLEHFENIESAVTEQLRVLKPEGVFLGYVVPERRLSVQTLAAPLNLFLRFLSKFKASSQSPSKTPLYRNANIAADYLAVMRKAGVRECGSFGMFPVPLVSHSPAFPFSLMSPRAERVLVKIWRALLSLRRPRRDPWICREGWGLAFLVWAKR
jgi:ubiquinone/menaquinone biosynthesis C-methylase UbiE